MLRSAVLAGALAAELLRPAECLKVPGLGIDPLKFVERVLGILLVTFILVVLFIFRKRVIFLLTGDDRLHITFQDILWFWCFKCIGTCDGEWTRCVTRTCFPRSWYNINLKKAFARYVGILPRQLEIRNVVAGDLPFKAHSGDFYVVIECGENPPKTSSICSSSPRIVYWPEVFRLRVRDSVWEYPINITVKELDVFGHKNVADIALPAHKVFRNFIGWRGGEVGQMIRMRFMLDPCDRADANTMTPSWVMIEFGLAPEVNYGLAAKYAIIESDEGAGDASFRSSHTATVNPQDALTSKNFKEQDPLRDKRGRPIREPHDISEERMRAKSAIRWKKCAFFTFTFLMLIGSAVFRLYLSRCWQDYEDLHIALGHNLTYSDFPLSEEALDEVDDWEEQVRPTEDAVVKTCESSPYHPLVFERFSRQDLQGHSIECGGWTCRQLLRTRKYKIFSAGLGVILFSIVCCHLFGPTPEPETAYTTSRRENRNKASEDGAEAAVAKRYIDKHSPIP